MKLYDYIILRVILVPLFTMQWIWTCQYIAQVSLAYWYSVGLTILRSRVRIPVVALSFLFDSKHSYEAIIYCVYCVYCDFFCPLSSPACLFVIFRSFRRQTTSDFCHKFVSLSTNHIGKYWRQLSWELKGKPQIFKKINTV